MATNEEILAAHAKLDELRKTRKKLLQTIATARNELAKIGPQLELAQDVHEVVDGVAIHVISETDSTFTMCTLAQGDGIEYRDAFGYQVANGEGWAVRVNSDAPPRPRFYGGKVLGLTKNWSRAQALDIARQWLVGQESVLVA